MQFAKGADRETEFHFEDGEDGVNNFEGLAYEGCNGVPHTSIDCVRVRAVDDFWICKCVLLRDVNELDIVRTTIFICRNRTQRLESVK